MAWNLGRGGERLRELDRLAASLEAYLFIHGAPVKRKELEGALDESSDAVAAALTLLTEKYSHENSGIMLRETGAGIALVTKKEYDSWLRETAGSEAPLSSAALETLAVVASKEPVTRAEIERIRGVAAGRVIASLIEKDLIEERGRLDVPGRPILYGTTKRFLQCTGLSDVKDLQERWSKKMTEGELF